MSQAVYVNAEMAAAEMQLLRQALDKLQSETQVLDDELARAREQAIFSELERAELSSDLESMSAQLQACQASKAELESTISKVMLKGHRVTLNDIFCLVLLCFVLSCLVLFCFVLFCFVLFCFVLPGEIA